MRTTKNTSDDDRVRLATRKGSRMLGPTEYQRCEVHPRRWVGYRWRWDAGPGGSPENGDVEMVVACSHPDHEEEEY